MYTLATEDRTVGRGSELPRSLRKATTEKAIQAIELSHSLGKGAMRTGFAAIMV
jgi:hypothetical protein